MSTGSPVITLPTQSTIVKEIPLVRISKVASSDDILLIDTPLQALIARMHANDDSAGNISVVRGMLGLSSNSTTTESLLRANLALAAINR